MQNLSITFNNTGVSSIFEGKNDKMLIWWGIKNRYKWKVFKNWDSLKKLRPNHELGSWRKPQDAYGRKFFINEPVQDAK